MAIEVKEAGRQTTEAAVAKTRVGLLVEDLPPLATVAAKTPLDYGIEHEVHDIVAERAADEELDREIVDPLRIVARVGLVGAQPAVGENVSYRAGGALVALARIGGLGFDDVVEFEPPLEERVRRPGEARGAEAVLVKGLAGSQ